jgi:D-arabinose 1-dehydrogenase-like Zn-dependent alcohol dehydrogenase
VTDLSPQGTMRAMRLVEPRPVTEKPLRLVELPIPRPGPGEVLVKVHACGVCHTDLHTVEGELEPHREAVIPGHQIVGEVVGFGDWPGGDRPEYPAADGRPLALGERVGVPWLWRADGSCRYCARGQENLCENALFTGYDVDGGYAEYHVANAAFTYRLPRLSGGADTGAAGFDPDPSGGSGRATADGFGRDPFAEAGSGPGGPAMDAPGRPALDDDVSAAPLLCAGVIGYRSLRLAGVVGDGAVLPGNARPGGAGAPRPTSAGGLRSRPASSGARLRSVSGAMREFGGSPAGTMPLDMVDGIMAQELDEPAGRLGLFGFGAAAHLCLQVAVSRGWRVYVFTRAEHHRELALQLGAAWAGAAGQRPGAAPPPAKPMPGQMEIGGVAAAAAEDAGEWLDAAIVFAPAGQLAIAALEVVDKAGIVALGGIHSSPIPPLDYETIYGERVLRSVANSTREDALELLRSAAAIPLRTDVEVFPLEQANEALIALKESRIRGAAVLKISD